MARRRNRYKELERLITICLVLATIIFIAFLSASGNGIVWLKVLYAILDLVICGFCLWLLYMRRELRKRRSFWMTVASAAIIICIIASIILNYPSPNIYG